MPRPYGRAFACVRRSAHRRLHRSAESSLAAIYVVQAMSEGSPSSIADDHGDLDNIDTVPLTGTTTTATSPACSIASMRCGCHRRPRIGPPARRDQRKWQGRAGHRPGAVEGPPLSNPSSSRRCTSSRSTPSRCSTATAPAGGDAATDRPAQTDRQLARPAGHPLDRQGHQNTLVTTIRRLYQRREANAPWEAMSTTCSAERLDTAGVEAGLKTNPIGLPTFLLGGAFLSGIFSGLQGLGRAAIGNRVLVVIVALAIVAVLASLAWVALYAAGVARRRIRLSTDQPMHALWDAVGAAGDPPRRVVQLRHLRHRVADRRGDGRRRAPVGGESGTVLRGVRPRSPQVPRRPDRVPSRFCRTTSRS